MEWIAEIGTDKLSLSYECGPGRLTIMEKRRGFFGRRLRIVRLDAADLKDHPEARSLLLAFCGHAEQIARDDVERRDLRGADDKVGVGHEG